MLLHLGRHPRAVLRQLRAYRRMRSPSRPLKLHLGCGVKRLHGFVNVDHNPGHAVDYVGDVSRLPCRAGSAERIEAYHVIEHIPQPVVAGVLGEWRRVLAPGGRLVLECPDFEADVRGYLAGDEEMLFSIFGRARYPGDSHHWGYTKTSLARLLEQVGFVEVRSAPPTDYHAEHEPCIRVEALAGGG